MSDSLHIESVALHLDIPASYGALERSSRRGLERCGPHVVAPEGLPADAVVAVRSLRVVLDVEGAPTDAQIARAFGSAFTESLAAVVRDVPAGVPRHADQRVVWFSDPHTAELEWMRAGFERSDGWWWTHVIEPQWRSDPAATVSSWMERAPQRWQHSVWSLLTERDPATSLPLEAVRQLNRRLSLPPVAREPRPRASADGSLAGGAGSVLSTDRGATTDSRAPDPATAAFVWRRASSEARRVFTSLGGPWRELAAFLVTASVLPSTRTWSRQHTAALARAAARRPYGSVRSPEGPGGGLRRADSPPDGTPIDASDAERGPVERPVGRTEDATAGVAESETGAGLESPVGPEGAGVDHAHAVFASGLLFLIRRLPWADLPVDPLELHHHLHALGRSLLQRVYDPLPVTARKAMVQGDAPLLAVFAGGPPDRELAQQPWTPASDRVVGPLLDGFPDTSVDPRLLGQIGLVPTTGSVDRALQALLLRPGLLELDAHRADLHLPLSSVDLALRLGGWDLDPGWVPALGRMIRVHYGERGERGGERS